MGANPNGSKHIFHGQRQPAGPRLLSSPIARCFRARPNRKSAAAGATLPYARQNRFANSRSTSARVRPMSASSRLSKLGQLAPSPESLAPVAETLERRPQRADDARRQRIPPSRAIHVPHVHDADGAIVDGRGIETFLVSPVPERRRRHRGSARPAPSSVEER